MYKTILDTKEYLKRLKTTVKNRNFVLNYSLKAILLISLFAFNLAFLFTLQQNFFRFGTQAEINPLYRVLFNTTQQWRDVNSTSILSSLLFYLIIVSSMLKNYININKNQILLNKYLPFFITYFLFSIGSVATYFLLSTITKSLDIWYLVIIVSFVFGLINIAYIFVNAKFSFKKMDPMEIKNQRVYVISYFFRVLFYIFAFYFGYAYFNINSESLLFNNSFTKFLKDLFLNSTPLHTFAITGIITFLVILFSAANLTTLFKVFKKDRTLISFKELFIFLGVIFSTILIWLLSRYSQIQASYSIFNVSTSYQYIFILSSIINIIIIVSYLMVLKLNLIKREIIKRTFDYSLLFIIWIIIAAIQLSIEAFFVISFTNLLTAIIASMIIVGSGLIQQKSMMLENQILLILFVLSALVFSFISIFKLDLINDGNLVVYRKVFGIDILTFTSLLPAIFAFILATWKGLTISLYTYNIAWKRNKPPKKRTIFKVWKQRVKTSQ